MDVFISALLAAALFGGLRLFVSVLQRDEARRLDRWVDDPSDERQAVAWARQQADALRRARLEGVEVMVIQARRGER